jgi:hypothetical protein
VWAGVGLGAVAVAALLVGRSMRTDVASAKSEAAQASSAAAKTARAAGPAPAASRAEAPSHTATAAPPPANLEERLADARRLIARGDWEQARVALEGLRAEAPDDAESAYLLATVDLEHHRYAEGMAAAHVATKHNPTLKSDPDLIKDVISALGNDAVAERAETFLRGAGPSATPFLKDAARKDPNPRVRDRAAEILASSGSGRSQGWSSRSSSSGSMFHR